MRTDADFPAETPKVGQTVRILYRISGGTELLETTIVSRSFHSDNYDSFEFTLPKEVNIRTLIYNSSDMRNRRRLPDEKWVGCAKCSEGDWQVLIVEVKVIG